MPELFSGLAAMWAKSALVSEVLAEAPEQAHETNHSQGCVSPRPQQPIDYALEAQDSLLKAGFSRERAFAGALQALAWERPLVFNKSGKGRRMSAKASRHLRALAVSIVVED